MKNILISSASALALAVCASAAFANDSMIDQIGGLNTASVDQTGGVEGVATVSQNGNANVAEVTQSENPNGIPGFTVPTNTAQIDQLGDNARARIEQSNPDQPNAPTNTASIYQESNGSAQVPPDGIPSGYSLNGRIIQNGSGNASSIAQFDNPNRTPNDGASGVTARNDQIGQYNSSTITQNVFEEDANPYSDVNVYQDGIANVSDVTQRGSDALVDVFQIGDNNQSLVEQGANREMTASVRQEGSDNESTISQVARTVTATVDQSGTSQFSDISQGPQSRFATATVTQSNDNNTSYVNQTNTSATATVTQWGTDGMSTINQSDGSGAEAILEQAGFANESLITQTGDDQYAFVSQDGELNESTISQIDDNQFASVTQGMDHNVSIIDQSGVGGMNTATVSQLMTSGNHSTITQAGTGNVATVMQ